MKITVLLKEYQTTFEWFSMNLFYFFTETVLSLLFTPHEVRIRETAQKKIVL